MQYKIHESKMATLGKKLETIRKKCIKYGNDFEYKVLDKFTENIGTDTEPFVTTFYMIEVLGTARIDNWEFVATMEQHTSGKVIRKYNTALEVPVSYTTSLDETCDHCNTKRQRKNLYLIYNHETNEYKQVGKSCLKLYTGGLSAEYVASYIELFGYLASLEEERDELHNHLVSSGVSSLINVKDTLRIATILTKKIGFFSKSNSSYSTAAQVSNYLFNEKVLYKELERRYNIELGYSDFTEENSQLEKEDVEKMVAYFTADEIEDNDYVRNIQVMLMDGYTSIKNIGYLASVPNSYYKAMDKAREKAERERKWGEQRAKNMAYEFFGEVGKRYTVKVNTISVCGSYRTEYGLIKIFKMTFENACLIWKTSSYVEAFYDADGTIQDNKEYELTFTVKEHSEYNGFKQTVVTRCRVK